MGKGKTEPCLITCEDADGGDDIEVVAKFSAKCIEREKNLAIEAIAAMLAADLGLPVPEPFIIEVDEVFIDSIVGDVAMQAHIRNSCRLAFGAKKVPDGFATWVTHGRVPKHLTQAAAEVFVFDKIIANADRRPDNPNCLHSGDAIAIFDHEMTLAMHQFLFWKEPWSEDGFDELTDPERHIFAPVNFDKKPENLDRFVGAWEDLSNDRFLEYCNALPKEWIAEPEFLQRIVSYLTTVKTNIRSIVDRGLEKLQ